LSSSQGRWTARFEPGADAEALTRAGFTAAGAEGQYHVEAADAAGLNAALDQARAAGALLVELKRDAQDLESVLTSAMEVAA
jgi:ABC-2 type transport system ATP-binding protein